MQKQLNKFRKKIDRIDAKLTSLLKSRSEIINEVKELKKDLHPKIRIARETLQAHAIQKKDFGFYQHNVMQKVWREFIFASLSIEGSLDIEVYNPNPEIISPLWVLTRDHFGTYANITNSNSLEKIIENLNNNKTTLAVVPFSDMQINWWDFLLQYPDIKACLSIPFLTVPNNIKNEIGIVLSKAKLEESQDDISLFLIEAKDLTPMPNIKFIFSNHNKHLILLNGFTKDRALVSNLTKVDMSQIFYLGTYPKPLQD
ncbi:chorismate mutase [Rickettsiales bacterium LUAb2]